MTETYNTISVTPVSRFVGAEISNVDISCGLSDEPFLEMRRAFVAHGVIFIRDQDLTPDQLIEFAKRWGKINVNRFFQTVDTHPIIAKYVKKRIKKLTLDQPGTRTIAMTKSLQWALSYMRAKYQRLTETRCFRVCMSLTIIWRMA